MLPFRKLSLFLVLLAALRAAPASATQVIALDTRALVSSSHDIVVGEVLAARSYWNPERTRIYTDVTVRVNETLRGATGTLTLTQMGGVVDGARYTVPGSPEFKPGEEALLFVWRDPSGRAQVNGLAQGKFDIRRDPSTGARLVQRTLPGLAVKDARSLSLVKSGERAPQLKLDDLLGEVRRAMAEDGR
jgi:hypothetical protein